MQHRRRTSGGGRRGRSKRLRNAIMAAAAVIVLCVGSLLLVRPPGKSAKESTETPKPVLVQGACGEGEKQRRGLEHSSLAQLRKLAEYETVCGTTVTNQMSFFVATPTTPQEAAAQSSDVATTLKEFARFHVSPVVFMEPRSTAGKTMSLTAYQGGAYDAVLDEYFAGIKAKGITDAQMGLWVPQPEGNSPIWGNPDPAVYTAIVTKAVTAQKKYFPHSKASVLLESKTAASSRDWIGTYTSFLPYVQNLPRNLIDSVGLQGFPWGASDNNKLSAQIDPQAYLRADLAIAAAQAVGAKQVWFNTGTFRHFGKSGFQPLDLTPEQRQSMLQTVVSLAGTVKEAGLQPAIHLFAKDKTQTTEKVDWSYWPAGQAADSPGTPALKSFVTQAHQAKVPIWLYDY